MPFVYGMLALFFATGFAVVCAIAKGLFGWAPYEVVQYVIFACAALFLWGLMSDGGKK